MLINFDQQNNIGHCLGLSLYVIHMNVEQKDLESYVSYHTGSDMD